MKAKSTIPEKILRHYETVIADTGVAELKGKTMPYTSVNGNMFSFLDPNGVMGLRLSAEDRDEFAKLYNALPMVQHGITMKEYVAVPDALLGDMDELAAWFLRSHRYVSGLKPKKAT